MISKNTIKLIKSLTSKKNRTKENLFLVEGDKNVTEVLKSSFKIEKLFATTDFLTENKQHVNRAIQIFEVAKKDINQASLLKNPQNCLALCTLPAEIKLPQNLENNLSVYLDDIQDPGNLGTIIRICDWFGINQLFCSPNTADVFNPKVIQASMGSFCHIQIIKTPFEHIAEIAHKNKIPVYGAFLEGKNLYEETLPLKAILIMGNEGNGIGAVLEGKTDYKIKIPGYSQNTESAESLNVSVATAIICAEFKRQNTK